MLRAQGEADRFLSVLGAYRTAPDITRERLHIEAIEGVLSEVELILLDTDAIGDQLLPILPLNGALNSSPTAPVFVPPPATEAPADPAESE